MEIGNEIEWRPVKGYESLYEVSNTGLVKSLSRISVGKKGNRFQVKEKLLKLNPTNGYLRAALTKDGTFKYHSVHRLVAEAFIKNHKKKPQINHLDRDRANNHVSNLEWVTAHENSYHRQQSQFLYPTITLNKLKDGFVCQFTHEGKNIRVGTFGSQELAHYYYLKKLKELGIENKYAAPSTY